MWKERDARAERISAWVEVKPTGLETTLGAKRRAAEQPGSPFEGLMNECPRLCRGMMVT